MAQLGADVEQLDQLSRKFDQEAQQIAQATQQISSQVNSVWWKGPDADRFRNEWEGQFAAQLKKENMTEERLRFWFDPQGTLYVVCEEAIFEEISTPCTERDTARAVATDSRTARRVSKAQAAHNRRPRWNGLETDFQPVIGA